MRLLVLGGTAFLGRHLVEAALAAGHQVTLFNRGQRNPDLFVDGSVEHLRGNRDGDLGALAGRRWDAAVDTSGYVPRIVHDSATLLANAVDHYTFVSSISVYADQSIRDQAEDAPLGTLEDASVEEITGETYGPLKALCEQAAEAAMPGRVLNVRPGLIVGPHDPTNRFTYWPTRIARGGEVLVPNRPEQPVQVIDVRDLAAWMLRMAVDCQTGVYNATGPEQPYTFRQVLEACRDVSGSDAKFTWVDDAFLTEHEVEPWMGLPLWLPENLEGMMATNVRKAVQHGLTFRPLADTIQATLEWDATLPADAPRRAGITPDREQALLTAWHARH